MSPTSHAPPIKDVLSSRQTPDGKSRHGFFSKELKGARKEWAKLTFLTFGLISVFMFLFLSIYFGSYYLQIDRADHYDVELIDLDSEASPAGSTHPAILGPAMYTAIQDSLQSKPHLGWYASDPATIQSFRITPEGRGRDAFEYAQQRVSDQDVWGVVIVNANATSGAWNAITGGSTWEPSGAMTFVFEESRNFYGAEQYLMRLSTQLMRTASSSAATELASQVLALGNATAVLAAAPPSSLIGAFSYNEHNLRLFDQLAGIASTTVGTVYLIIFTFLISVTWNNLALPLIADKLVLASEILVKILVPFVGYFWLALHYSLVSLAFQINFTRQFGKGGFVVYWMANWITMSALGFVMETVFLWLGPFFPFFLVFWVILNVSVAFLDIGNMASFYSYGYAFPIWNLVDMSKSIIFATKNHLAQNFAVNLGWMFVWMIILGITVAVQRRKAEAARMKQIWSDMKRKDEDEVVGQVPDKERRAGDHA